MRFNPLLGKQKRGVHKMRVKIGDKVYDSELEPIMLILSSEDKKNISSMTPKAKKYCSFPDSPEYTEERILEFMKGG